MQRCVVSNGVTTQLWRTAHLSVSVHGYDLPLPSAIALLLAVQLLQAQEVLTSQGDSLPTPALAGVLHSSEGLNAVAKAVWASSCPGLQA